MDARIRRTPLVAGGNDGDLLVCGSRVRAHPLEFGLMSVNLLYSSDRFQVFEHPGGAVDLYALTEREPSLFLKGHEATTLRHVLNALESKPLPEMVAATDRYLTRYFGGKR